MFTVRNRVLLAKEESVYGTDPTPVVASNAIEARDLKINYNVDLLTRDNVRSNISPVSPVVGKRYAEISFTCELKGSGAAGTAPRIGDLLEACAFAETVSAGSSVIYKPTSSAKKSVTIYAYDLDSASCVLRKFLGCVGNVQIKLTAGQYAQLEFSMRGLCTTADADAANPAAPTYESTLPPIVESAAFTINAVSLIVQDLNINMDNSVSERDDISSAGSIKAFEIAAREPKGTFNPELVTIASYDFKTLMTASTQQALSVVVGSAAGNKCTITAPKVTIDSLADGERERFLVRDVGFRLGQNVGNDEIQLKFE